MSTSDRTAIMAVVLPFGAITAATVWLHGYSSVFTTALGTLPALQLASDLVVALVLLAVWMVRDAGRRGIVVWPYLLLTAALGSFGPLLYLWRHGREG